MFPKQAQLVNVANMYWLYFVGPQAFERLDRDLVERTMAFNAGAKV